MTDVDNYLDNVANPQKEILQHIRELIAQTAPDAIEVITYGMPGFKYKGKYLIAYASFKDHMSIFPGSSVIEVLGNALKSYKISKGTIQFTANNTLPNTLIQNIVKTRMKDIDNG